MASIYQKSDGLGIALADSYIIKNHSDLNVGDMYYLVNEFGYTAARVNNHATMCAGVLDNVCDNVEFVSIALPPLNQIPFDTEIFDAVEYISSLINCLNNSEKNIEIVSVSSVPHLDRFYNTTTCVSIVENFNGLLVYAAGNEIVDYDNPATGDSLKRFPTVLEADNMLVVGGSNPTDGLWIQQNDDGSQNGTNTGLITVDLFAPAQDIRTTTITNQESVYDTVSGTSFAAPMVAGVAGLMKLANPNLTNLQIKAILLNTVDRSNAFIGKCVSGGRLNAYEAVRIAHQLAQDNPSLTQDDIDKSNFLFHGSSCEIIKYVGNQTDPIIPETINDFEVTKIADRAFLSISYLNSVNIPSFITQIGDGLFKGCTSLKNVTILSSITAIPASTFQKCGALKEVILPDTITSIGENAFLMCDQLESILLPPSLNSIADTAFDSSLLLYVAYDPNAELDNTDDDSEETETQVEEITAHKYAINNGMSYCIVSGDTITYYSDGNNSILRDLVLPSTFFGPEIVSIANHAFDEADNIVSVEIPSSVTSIGYRAFRNCDMLRTVIIPSSVTSISNSMNSTIVEGSTNAAIYCARGTYAYAYSLITDATFIYMSLDGTNKTASIDGIKESDNGGTEYFIPETFNGHTVTSIASGAFGTDIIDEKRVTKIYVPETVESIGSNAFSTCANLTDIYIYSKDTELGSNCLPPYNRDSITIHCYMPSPAFLYATGNGYNYSLL